MSVLTGKHIILGVTGSIAAYKVAELARNLTLEGAIVDVIMTAAAQRFVGAATFQALTGRPVLVDMWALPEDGVVGHVSLGQHADLLVIAPATANTIARLAAGLCDDLLTTTALATTAPMLIAPAMNPRMYEHPATQANIALLRQRGVIVLEPAYGRMAEPVIGRGRLPEPSVIEAEIRALLGRTSGPLRGRRVVVTAGGTHEPIDPVRFIGNRASGRMGYAIAAAARDRGASVVLISGPATVQPPHAVNLVRVETAIEMQREVESAIADADLLIMNAAVADFRPAAVAGQKIKKGDDEELTIRLVRNPDILASIAHRRDLVKIGFAAETHDLLAYARDKLERKGLDMIVANEAVASIGAEDIQLMLIDAQGVERLPLLPKAAAAELLLDAIVARFAARLRTPEPEPGAARD
ncbi:MAG: bifunctional phosphopantothenoylcysteine decarboxylase/phosphopantothenate--cysteine ligase CoaBC [Roseiflexaceae bacterium]|nr:bifunctional phosphopantothenoylcysteine decarboxylase/phosphopantothenate--cysteine ligase CoaBC [Roseiflexus sp.]MDW8212468.1 bifunctional phosphopantothenoylcysteine decarboxylase/phosphopantothenate--cysteine ligase CoaBC [Roseiflexaceae bacterium]